MNVVYRSIVTVLPHHLYCSDMEKPTVHLNGTSKEALCEDYCAAGTALRVAIDALVACSPHGRDYYVQDGVFPCGGAFKRASSEHSARLQALKTVLLDIQALHAHCEGDNSRMWSDAEVRAGKLS